VELHERRQEDDDEEDGGEVEVGLVLVERVRDDGQDAARDQQQEEDLRELGDEALPLGGALGRGQR
jgi:hypothetical protein